MLYFTSLASETQVNVGEATSPGPSSLVPATRLSCSCSDVSNRAASGELSVPAWSLTGRILAGRRQLCVWEPRPGWAGLEWVSGLAHGVCLPLAMCTAAQWVWLSGTQEP